MVKKNTTIDNLAVMIKKGFDGIDDRFDVVDENFKIVEDKLENIEKLILADHKRRIEKLESEVKELKELLAMR